MSAELTFALKKHLEDRSGDIAQVVGFNKSSDRLFNNSAYFSLN